MHTTTIGGLPVTHYDDIKVLPAVLYQKARQYEVMDAELAGSEADLDAGLAKLQLLHRAGQTEAFEESLHNLRLARQLILTNYNPKQLEWACYLHSVDGVPLTDYSETALEALITRLNPAQAEVEAVLAVVKKNSQPD